MLDLVSYATTPTVQTIPSTRAQWHRAARRRRYRGNGYEFAHIEPGELSDLTRVLPCPGCGEEARDGDLAFRFGRGDPETAECWHHDHWLAEFCPDDLS